MNDRFWKWMALIIISFGLIALSLFATKNIYDFILPKEDVLKSARTALLRMERDSSLVSTRAFVQAVVRKRNEMWYGTAEVIRIVPATINYAVNLAEIDRNQIEYDEQGRILYVPLPDVKIHSIDPDLTKAEIIRNIGILRSESMTGNILEEETEKMVRPTLEEMGKSPDIINIAKEQSIISVRQFLEAALNATGMPIQVRPYFKSDGKGSIREKNQGTGLR
jgi:hypothetical protein